MVGFLFYVGLDVMVDGSRIASARLKQCWVLPGHRPKAIPALMHVARHESGCDGVCSHGDFLELKIKK
jgi:hypothetical protein